MEKPASLRPPCCCCLGFGQRRYGNLWPFAVSTTLPRLPCLSLPPQKTPGEAKTVPLKAAHSPGRSWDRFDINAACFRCNAELHLCYGWRDRGSMGRSPLHFSACMSAMLSLAQASMESHGEMHRIYLSPHPNWRGSTQEPIQIRICILDTNLHLHTIGWRHVPEVGEAHYEHWHG